MKTRANGIEIGYDVNGQGDWLVLCHSLGVDRSVWFQQVPDFETHHRVLTWDARGHGETSDVPGPYDFDLMAQDLIGLLDSLDIQRTALLGLSMGGDIAMTLASAHPGRVSALILCDTSARFGPDAQRNWRDRIEAARREGIAPVIGAQAERWFTDDFRASRPEVVERVLDLFGRTGLEGYIGAMEALARVNLLPRLADISCPTLIVVGDQDPATGSGMAEAIRGAIPGSRLMVLEHARHLAAIEQAGAFNQAVLEFLAGAGA
jgi:3-oxoadipate enol-lactonase